MANNKLDLNFTDEELQDAIGTSMELPEVRPEEELPDVDLSAAQEDIRKEQLYGDKALEAFTGQALSTATVFGATDVAARAAGVSPERLREVRERSPVATGLGTAIGIIVPAAATLGTSAAAQAIATPVRVAGAVGAAAEKAATKALTPLIGKEAAKRSATQAIVAGAARGGAEGAVAGAGQLVQDVALERADLSMESAIGTIGVGAALGTGLGAVIGTAQASVPSMLKGANKILGVGKKLGKAAAGDFSDDVEIALGLSSGTSAQRQSLKNVLGEKYLPDLPEYYKKYINLEVMNTADDLVTKNQETVKQVGKRLGEVSKQLDDITTEIGSPISRAQVYNRLLTVTRDELEALGPATGTTRTERAIIKRYMNDIIKLGSSEKPFSFKEIDDLRKTYAGKKWRFGGELTSAEAELANKLRISLRESIDEIAEKVRPELADELKSLNKAYHIGNTIQDNLEFIATRTPNVTEPIRFAISTAGRFARNFAVKNDIASSTTKFMEAIATGVDKLFKERVPKAALTFPSTSILLKTQLAADANGKAAKTKQQAVLNIQNNVAELVTNPDKMVDVLAKKTARISAANPELGMAAQERLANAINFINSKVPRAAVSSGMFERPYNPSSMELAKFERYVQVIEQPLSVFNELSQGTLTREHVEALQAVYPEVYNQIRSRVMQQIVDKGPQLAYERKLQIGILLNIPADSSLQPQTVMQLQQSINAQPEQQQPAPQFRPSGLQQSEISERSQSATEKLTNR